MYSAKKIKQIDKHSQILSSLLCLELIYHVRCQILDRLIITCKALKLHTGALCRMHTFSRLEHVTYGMDIVFLLFFLIYVFF